MNAIKYKESYNSQAPVRGCCVPVGLRWDQSRVHQSHIRTGQSAMIRASVQVISCEPVILVLELWWRNPLQVCSGERNRMVTKVSIYAHVASQRTPISSLPEHSWKEQRRARFWASLWFWRAHLDCNVALLDLCPEASWSPVRISAHMRSPLKYTLNNKLKPACTRVATMRRCMVPTAQSRWSQVVSAAFAPRLAQPQSHVSSRYEDYRAIAHAQHVRRRHPPGLCCAVLLHNNA